MLGFSQETGKGGRLEGRFGTGLASIQEPAHVASLPGNPAWRTPPFTVECWTRILGKATFNILVASEPKSSPMHWELYTFAGSGNLSVYMPGNKPDTIVSNRSIADGNWHFVAMTHDGTTIRLYVDCQPVGEGPYAPGTADAGEQGPLFLGDVEGIGCHGVVDDVRISKGIRAIGNVPVTPLENDADTLALLHFDEPGSAPAPSMDRMPPGNVKLADGTPCQQRIWTHTEWPGTVSISGVRAAVVEDWKMQFDWLRDQQYGLGISNLLPQASEQVYDRHALIQETDRDPADVVLRRTGALFGLLEGAPGVEALTARFAALEQRGRDVPPMAREEPCNPARQQLYLDACALRRELAFLNPKLDFDDILFGVRGVIHGPMEENADWFGQHQTTQYFAFNSVAGGGIFVIKGFKGEAPQFVNILENSVFENGRHQGERPNFGAFISPDLSYDGKTILFSWTENERHREHVPESWTENSVWHVCRVNSDGTNLRQLTDGPYNDFHACWLPNGRVAFISERRGGFIRCFVTMWVPNYVLHSMKDDGSDIYPISYFETSEWDPSVNNDGMLVYTRWDYVDRNDCLGSNFWICNPDGRDPRAPHGNYPQPWHTIGRTKEESLAIDQRFKSPFTEMGIRQIPGSNKYILSAVPHHGEAFGSLCILDLHKTDDGAMNQLRRITPYAKFPEVETPGRRYDVQQYGTAWPLSEDIYLCNYYENLYLLDRFGNLEFIAAPKEVSCRQYPFFRAMDPVPFRARPVPPVIPTLTNQGTDAIPGAPKARISVMNVYDTDQPFPEGTKIKWLRILQNIVKDNYTMDKPRIGYANENCPRIPLGIVPVEEDGSAHFWAPVEKELIFQVLDENYMAVQSMKSVAFAHPGEHLTCAGCHEPIHATPAKNAKPMALDRTPSTPQPETGPIEPVNFHRLVEPVIQATCLPCHTKEGRGPQDMSYAALEPLAFYWAGGFLGDWVNPEHNGSRTIPGMFGARHAKIGKKLLEPNHRKNITDEEYRRFVLWLDSNSPELGAFHDEEAQRRGELIWPKLDVDPKNPMGLEQ